MPKARHRKRVRTARLAASSAPIGGRGDAAADAQPEDTSATPVNPIGAGPLPLGANGNSNGSAKKVGKKESEVTNLLDKLKSEDVSERIWASSALSNILLTIPAVQLRLLLSKNLIGLLIERLSDNSEEVAVESLFALRNLAVSSPASIVSEMHNKKLLTPLTTIHLPILLTTLPSALLPPSVAATAPLPSTAEQRKAVEATNEKDETRRRLFWDWSENVFVLFWCLAETNTKILNSLNARSNVLVELCLAYLTADALGLSAEPQFEGMDVEGKKSKKGKKETKKERVPLFVAVAAAQALYAFISSNPSAHSLVLNSPNSASLPQILSSPSPPTTRTARSESHASSDPASEAQDWLQLRVVSFGILLELTKSGKKGLGREEIRSGLKETQSVLLNLMATNLQQVAEQAESAAGETSAAAVNKLTSYETQLSTLQLSLEVLGEWCACLDAEGLGAEFDDQEEWAGIGADAEGDVAMDENDVTEEAVIQKDDVMESEEEVAALELSNSAISLFSELPKKLLNLTKITKISFRVGAAANSHENSSAPNSLLPTSAENSTATESGNLPDALQPIADIITTIHVRALECLNNLYITLARSSSSESVSNLFEDEKNLQDLQTIWETALNLVQEMSSVSVNLPAVAAGKVPELDDLQERRMEIIMAGIGVGWGIARIGLEEERNLIVGPSTTPFLIQLFSHPYATLATPAAESIRVRILGILGSIARRSNISNEENSTIGNFLLSILPADKSIASTLTPEVLLQSVDSLIDIYSDEESNYDVAVFRNENFLPRLESIVGGIRAAVRKIDRKRFPELKNRADGILTNLLAFVDYRKSVE